MILYLLSIRQIIAVKGLWIWETIWAAVFFFFLFLCEALHWFCHPNPLGRHFQSKIHSHHTRYKLVNKWVKIYKRKAMFSITIHIQRYGIDWAEWDDEIRDLFVFDTCWWQKWLTGRFFLTQHNSCVDHWSPCLFTVYPQPPLEKNIMNLLILGLAY